jgi:TFIIH basal transcription factor complex TTD-A subunit
VPAQTEGDVPPRLVLFCPCSVCYRPKCYSLARSRVFASQKRLWSCASTSDVTLTTFCGSRGNAQDSRAGDTLHRSRPLPFPVVSHPRESPTDHESRQRRVAAPAPVVTRAHTRTPRHAPHLVRPRAARPPAGAPLTRAPPRASDSAVKQILLALNERDGAAGGGFVIEDLDDFHLLVAPGAEGRVRRELDAELEKNTYSLESAER